MLPPGEETCSNAGVEWVQPSDVYLDGGREGGREGGRGGRTREEMLSTRALISL